MSEVLTRDEGERRPTIRQLYEAARHDHISRAHERTFEEWSEKVSDYGLDDAQQAYLQIRDCEHQRLQSAMDEAVRGESRKGMLTPWIREARDALIEFEAENEK
jgi:hypothetical protein